MLMGTSGASLLGDISSKILLGKGVVRAGEGILKRALFPGNSSPHILKSFEIKRLLQK